MFLTNDWPARHAKARPGKTALVDEARGVSLDYATLDRMAGALARHLSREGRVGVQDRVAVLAESRWETVVAFFAVARLRATLVPMNAKLSAPELGRVLASAKPTALLHSDELAAMARALLEGTAGVGALSPRPALVASYDDPAFAQVLAGPMDGVPREAVVEESDPWLVLYTSGSTGVPKGALVTHRQIVMNAVHTLLACDLTADDVTVTYTPLFYTGGWNVLSTPLWYRGGTVRLAPAFDPKALLRTIPRERVSVAFGVPTTLTLLAREPGFAEADLSSLRVLLCGGAACTPALVEQYARKGISLRPGYGLTEVGPNSFGVLPSDPREKLASIGRPNLHLEARVTDEGGREVPAGEEGELRLRGPTIFGGYLGNPEATAAALDAEGFFRTGDIVRRDADGFFWLVGRKGDMFKSGGEKVYAGEVEAAIAQHPGVAEVVVFGVPDETWGEVGRAVVVPRAGFTLEESELREFLDGRLARFKRPKSWAFVDAFPRLETGKVARAEVKRRFAGEARVVRDALLVAATNDG